MSTDHRLHPANPDVPLDVRQHPDHPTIFNTADIALITKIDLAEAVGFDRAVAGVTP